MSFITAALDKIAAPERRTLAVAGGAHILHDGFTDLLYVLLPLWQAEFGLGYAEVGLLRSVYAGAMAGFQVPAGLLAERCGGRAVPGPRAPLARGGLAPSRARGGVPLFLLPLLVRGGGGRRRA